ncbi:DNA gyrase inhibitor YacG [Antarcticimicrobium sediminis]|uniref:DNA gyrase inhibitor YacG n=1 Tax=Antarcticimicrobium sediminis TaxID=2546227 RepID=A0A4R5EME2_9RHOB|nr:DNA gyrase inhibitor YacG [Antarcticimicrobium sediminis]TDE35560.1 DNA gyrase inhibitor YacG [Antarcticimicrobium sediminis]
MSCPICKGASDPAYRPFCSKRCANIDLGNWLDGTYAVPSDSPEDLDKAAEQIETDHHRPH